MTSAALLWLNECPSPVRSPDSVQRVLFVIQAMFQYVTSLMKQGYQEESNRQRHLAVSPKERPDKKNTAL